MATTFEALPDEVKLIIFSFITISELRKTISIVCKEWWALSKDPRFWKQVTLDFKYDTYEVAMEEVEERVQGIAAGLKRCTMLEDLSLTNERWRFRWEIPRHFFFIIGPIPTLKSLLFNGIDIKVNTLVQIKENFPFIQKLSFKNCLIEFNTNYFATGCPALVHLKEFILVGAQRSFDFDDTCLDLLSRCCTELESLEIEKRNFTDKGIMALAKNSNKTLQRVLLLCKQNETLNDGYVHFGSCQKLISLELKGFNVLSQNCLKALSELPILETLLLRGLWPIDLNCTAEEKEQMENGFEIFFGNPFRAKLKYVELTGLSLGDSALINMSLTCSSLKKLHIDYCFGITQYGVGEIFENCSALDYMSVRRCKPLTANRTATRINDVNNVNGSNWYFST